MTDQTAAVEVWARMLCAADVHVNDGDHPTWQQLATMPGRGQDEYRKAAQWLLPRLTVGQPAPPSAPADRAERRDRYAAAMAKRDGHEWPTEFEDDERDYRRRADAAMAVADAEQAAPPSVPVDGDLRTLIRGVIRDCPALYPDDIADRVLAVLQSAYRRLLARLEADRAGHLRAAGQATEEVLRIDGVVSASTIRHAAARVIAAFEGPDAAQAYMQRTEGGELPVVEPTLGEPVADPAVRRETVEFFVQSQQPGEAWEQASSTDSRLGFIEKRIANLQERFPEAKFRIVQRNTTVVVQPLENCPQCAWGVDHVEHCPHPESHNAGCGCFSDEPPAQEPTPERADHVLDERVAAAKEQQAGEGR